MKNLLKFLLIIGWMIVINSFSSQVGVESSKTSGFVFTLLTSIGVDLNSMFGNFSILVIRKSAHMFVYFVLFFLNFNFIKDFLVNKYNLFYSSGLSLALACLDEYHQTFVPMRAGSIIDVGVDMIGVLMGVILFLLIRFLRINCLNNLFTTNK
ncbi:MAG: putative phosphotransbutyrylase [Haloplasmataceae bacterium]|jgi:VanZ family protein|nr:putative phosphotransbutyrylase [Haloplasmataceae bacterium]